LKAFAVSHKYLSQIKSPLALFIPTLGGGGAERTMLNLAQGFSDYGIVTDLVVANAKGPYAMEIPESVNLIDLKSSRVFTCIPRLVSYLRSRKPFAIISTLTHANFITVFSRAFSRVPSKVIVREANTLSEAVGNSKSIKMKLMPLLVMWSYSRADRIIAVSDGVADDLSMILGIDRGKITVISNPVVSDPLFSKVDEPLQHAWFEDSAPPVILAVGRLEPVKDYITLIKAFDLVRKSRQARLIILGEGSERKRLEEFVNSLSHAEDISMPGFVNNPFNYMAKASLFVLSSLYEGLPNVLIQAMACGCQIVSTDCKSGPREILDGGRYGYLVPVGDDRAMANAIISALEKEYDRSALVARAKQYSFDNATQKYLKCLGVV
jgi:glycosyltransferase involved in cell wall biosynthesis